MDKVKALLNRFKEYMLEDFGPDEPLIDVPGTFKKIDDWMLKNVWNAGLSDEEKLEVKKDFADWWNKNIATEEDEQWVVEEPKDFVGEGGTMSTVVETQEEMDIAEEEAKEPYYTNVFTYGMSEESFNKSLGLFGVNPSEDAVYAHVAELEPGDPFIAEALDYLALMTGETLLRPKYTFDGVPVIDKETGTQVLAPFEGHFQGIKVEDFIDSNATFDEINKWQTYLEKANIVPDNYFAESRGQYSEKLRASIKYVMNWLDENRHVVKGTDTYEVIMQQNPIYFTSIQEKYGDAKYHRNLLQYALEEMAVAQAVLDDVEEEKIAKKLAKEFIPPSKGDLEEMVEAYFEQKLGRKPTATELDQWSTTFADSYSLSFDQARAKAKQLDDYNFMVSQPEYLETQAQQESLQASYGNNDFIDLSQFSYQTPEEIMETQLEGEFGKQMDAVESGRRIRKLQSDLMSYMAGR